MNVWVFLSVLLGTGSGFFLFDNLKPKTIVR
jgi:hypothetical protein